MDKPFSFIAEGKRLGIQPPPFLASRPAPYTYDDGLCITACNQCRRFRNQVREALAAEAEAAKPENQPGYKAGRMQGFQEGYLQALRDARLEMTRNYPMDLERLDQRIRSGEWLVANPGA